MATITFKAGLNDITINNLSGSGLQFFGSAAGNSVAVGEYQQTTYIGNGDGTQTGSQINNVKYQNVASGFLGSATSGIQVRCFPNYLATLNINFSHSTAVKTQNNRLYIYDRTSIANNASGVTTKVYECIHPTITNILDGSGGVFWQSPNGSSYMNLVSSPGQSGTSINGINTTQNTHDWYLAISASPDSIGSKTLYGLYFSTEYL